MAERRQKIKTEMETLHDSLSFTDRRILQTFFGYLGIEGERAETKNVLEACSFVKHTIFYEDEPKTPFKPTEIDWETFKKFPSIFSSDKKDVISFLSTDGLKLNDTEQVAVVRAMQVW